MYNFVTILRREKIRGSYSHLRFTRIYLDLRRFTVKALASIHVFKFIRTFVKVLSYQKLFCLELLLITLLYSFEKSCLSQKLFVTHSSVCNRVKVRTKSKAWCLMKQIVVLSNVVLRQNRLIC